jgi:ABC-2 type transport system ATP-binding protein
MGLSDKLHNQATALSRGQRQRLAIGQAIIHAPKVLLLDEPASGLDPEARSALAQVFRALQAQGMSLLVSSHILAELDEYSTHMLAIHQGRVLEHRALGHTASASSDAQRERMLRLEFVLPSERLAPWLKAQPGVRLYRSDEQVLELGFTGDRQAQADLVRAMVTAGHPLLSIAPITENLQQSYLKSLAAERASDPTRRNRP